MSCPNVDASNTALYFENLVLHAIRVNISLNVAKGTGIISSLNNSRGGPIQVNENNEFKIIQIRS